MSQPLVHETTESSASTEFKRASNEDLRRLIGNTENKHSKRATQMWINRFNSWRNSRNIAHEVHEIPPEELEKVLN